MSDQYCWPIGATNDLVTTIIAILTDTPELLVYKNEFIQLNMDILS